MTIRHPVGVALTFIGCIVAALLLIKVVHLNDYLTDLTLSEQGRIMKQQMMQQQQEQQLQQQ